MIPKDILASQTLTAFPELEPYKDQIYFIDATIGSRQTFLIRDTVEIVNDIRKAKEEGCTKFFFYLFSETFLPYIAFKIHRIARLLEDIISSSDFFYLTGAVNGDESYDNWFSKTKFKSKINVLSAAMFHSYLLNRIDCSLLSAPLEYTYEVKTKPKKFLCFNKLEREQRLRLLDRMIEKNYVSLGYYSFETLDASNINPMVDLLHDERFANIRKHRHILPLTLNINPNRTNPVDIIPDDLQYFHNSYFSIVNETVFYDATNYKGMHLAHQLEAEPVSIFISEKTYKCLAMKHPFVLFGRPGTLKALRTFGFKTFSPFINEYYDTIEDDEVRFDFIFHEIERLLHLSDDEWLILQQHLKDIVEHNHTVFFNTISFGTTPDVLNRVMPHI